MGSETLTREFEENGILMQEFEVVSDSGKRHIVITPKQESRPQPEPKPAVDRLAVFEQQNLILMNALADMYEEILAIKEDS